MEGQHVANVTPPDCFCCFMTFCSDCEDCKEMPFEVTNAFGRPIGVMKKEKIGANEATDFCYIFSWLCCGGANYMESFHMQVHDGVKLKPKHKALLLGTAVLLDITFFETHTENDQSNLC